MNLNMFPDFKQVLSIIKKHPIKIEHFSKHTLLTTIYLLQKEKLNHINYSDQ
jgi:hypothetical protein